MKVDESSSKLSCLILGSKKFFDNNLV